MSEEFKKPPTVDLSMPELEKGQSMKITNIGDNYVLSELETSQDEQSFGSDYVRQATYDFEKLNHTYSRLLDKESSTYVTSTEELTNLAKNTQNSLNKILKINGIVKYYINKEDLIGRVIETIENNVNINFKVNYPNIALNATKKKELKMIDEIQKLVDKFNKQINIPQLIRNNALTTYSEGNYIYYLMGDYEHGYGIVTYPLDLIEVTPMKVDNEPVIALNVNELKSRLQSSRQKYRGLKSNKLIDIEKDIENEIKRDYPKEVYDAFIQKDTYALLDPKRIGVSRINNLKGLYGLTPIFKSLGSQLILETIDKSDQKLLIQKTKKIYYQKSRKELMGEKYTNKKPVNEIGYSHASLVQAMGQDTVIYSSMPYIEDLEILEPKTELTDANTVSNYRNRVLSALGISFVSGESKASTNTIKINYSELLKIVNKISKQLEPVINKFYQLILEENGFLVEYSPIITIEDTELLDADSKLKLVDLVFSKIGLSYDSTFNILGLDANTEVNKRIKENKGIKIDGVDTSYDSIFAPHSNSYTSNSNDLLNNDKEDDSTNSNGSVKNTDSDKNLYDKERQESIVK